MLDNLVEETRESIGKHSTLERNNPINAIIGDPNKDVSTRSKVRNQIATLLQIKYKNVNEALEDESWVEAMKEELE